MWGLVEFTDINACVATTTNQRLSCLPDMIGYTTITLLISCDLLQLKFDFDVMLLFEYSLVNIVDNF
jgi:hypothetical protein